MCKCVCIITKKKEARDQEFEREQGGRHIEAIGGRKGKEENDLIVF